MSRRPVHLFFFLVSPYPEDTNWNYSEVIENNPLGSDKNEIKWIYTTGFNGLQKTDVVLNALIRKTQVRLMDANKKSSQLASEISDLLSSMKADGGTENELSKRIANLRKKITEINSTNND